MDPALAVPTTTDMHFKSQFVLHVLLNEILGKCEEKCKVCENHVQQLHHHIIQAHCEHPNPSPHTQTVTVFKCDVCSSIYSSPSMLIRHRNTHSDNSDTLTTPCTIEPEPVRFNSNNIYTSFDLSPVTRTNESVSSSQCENHPQQLVPVSPNNVEWNCFKQEELFSSQSELEISNPNPLGILEHMNHLSTIENNLKQECNDLECEEDLHDPLLLQDSDLQVLQIPSFVKYECTWTSTKSEEQTVLMTHEKSSNDTHTGRDSLLAPSDLIKHKITQSVQKAHKCDICGKCFGRPYHLTRHKLTHSGERPFQCDECGRGFPLKYSLGLHRLTHTGEGAHKCDVCGKCFAQSSILIRHKLRHTGERPYECDVCGRGFGRNAHLTKHKLTHTPP